MICTFCKLAAYFDFGSLSNSSSLALSPLMVSTKIDLSNINELLSEPITSSRIVRFLETLSDNHSTSLEPEIKEYSDVTYHNYHSLGISLCFSPAPLTSSSTKERILDYIDIYNPPMPPNSSTTTSYRRKQKEPWDGYSIPRFLPLIIDFPTSNLTIPAPTNPGEGSRVIQRPIRLELTTATTGRDFVSCFGEPSKKGGGLNSFVPPFLEWDNLEIVSASNHSGQQRVGGRNAEESKEEDGDEEEKKEEGRVVRIGIMVELRDPGAKEVLTDQQKIKGAGGLWDRAAGWTWVGLKIFKATGTA